MTPPILKCAANFDIAMGVANVTDELTFSWVLFAISTQYVFIVVSSSFFSGSLALDLGCVEVVQKDAILEGPPMHLFGFSI